MGAKRCPQDSKLGCGELCVSGGPEWDVNVLKARCTLTHAADSELDCTELCNSECELMTDSEDSDG
jgi:hypothetical protein